MAYLVIKPVLIVYTSRVLTSEYELQVFGQPQDPGLVEHRAYRRPGTAKLRSRL